MRTAQAIKSNENSPRPCSKMRRFSSVPSSLALYTKGTGILDDVGAGFVLGAVLIDSRSAISFSPDIKLEVDKVRL